jgi:hypothetical protein
MTPRDRHEEPSSSSSQNAMSAATTKNISRRRQRPLSSASTASQDEKILKWIYYFVTFLCGMMVVWILYFPGSWLVGRSKLHDDIVLPVLDGKIVPREIVIKYAGHTLVHMTHILPGAVWAGAIPFQLNPSFRKRRPVAHRRIGYAFLTSSFVMTIGIMIIMYRKLFFEHFFEDLPPKKVSSAPAIYSLTMIFAYSAVKALNLAREKRFLEHQIWIIRHIESGLWIAIQRFLLVFIFPVLFPDGLSRAGQRDAFGHAALMGGLISVALGEQSIKLLRRRKMRRPSLKQA